MFRAGNTASSSTVRRKGRARSDCILAASSRSAPRFGLAAPNLSIISIVACNIHHSDNATLDVRATAAAWPRSRRRKAKTARSARREAEPSRPGAGLVVALVAKPGKEGLPPEH